MVQLVTGLTRLGARDHEVGVLMQRHPSLASRFPVPELSIELRPASNPDAAERAELAAYLERFGEGPPFNVRCR